MTTLTGEIIGGAAASYIKHPPPSGTDMLSNGMPVDAGSLMIADSNISVLVRESTRQLVWSLGPGQVRIFGNASDALNDISGFTPTGIQTLAGSLSYNAIPWGDRRTSARFGPFIGAADDDLGVGGGAPQIRTIHCVIDVNITAGLRYAYLYFALTRTPEADAVYGNSFVAFAQGSVSTPTPAYSNGIYATLQAGGRISMAIDTVRERCRTANPPGNSVESQVPILYVWFGWLFVATSTVSNAQAFINGFAAWEAR